MSSAPLPADLQAALDLFRAQFAEQLPARLAEADACLQAWSVEPGNDERLRDLHRVLHRLAGAAGTFGMPSFGDACKAIELQLDALLAQPRRSGGQVDVIARQVAALADARG